ncbi:hypothetical protein FPZ43_00055 [Mucilaginibacter pallidiroseus]|uniref:Uncharacterized protein n=1 Tax=Mucilaginibacter pallidiroseus TaxID=2599295 RepID=A0A563UHU7_9SPHI|nr:hypothetical protein [Mucilaginibacter pallidiroseus]TWR30911.1 hypothetical protein FPZ43_00055 [Mucilaginibacter pallidiroseus]
MEQTNTISLKQPTLTMLNSTKKVLLLFTLSLMVFSCKKFDGTDRDYGYAKLTVKCSNCSVSYTTAGQLNSFTVNESTAINYIRYKANYNLDINIQSLDAKQPITLGVYSRSGKQVFLNTSVRAQDEVWNSKIVIP